MCANYRCSRVGKHCQQRHGELHFALWLEDDFVGRQGEFCAAFDDDVVSHLMDDE